MESLNEHEPTELFRSTIREMIGLPENELELASMVAMMGHDEKYRIVAEQELAPVNGHLELHLSGETVVQHATNARPFGQFVLQMAESVKSTARDISGAKRLKDELLIETGPGSVKTTFVAPPRRRDPSTLPTPEKQEPLIDDDRFSEALRRVAVVFANVEGDLQENPALDSAISQIPAASRLPLKKALDEVLKQEWSLEGSFTQRGIGVTRVKVHPHSISYLRARLAETVVSTDTWESTGYLDGHTWSTGTMRFIPVKNSRPITASFGDSEVQLEVGKLDSKPSQKVRVRMTVHSTIGLTATKKSYVLDSISSIDEAQGTPPLF
ncbi:hypothetical protein [Okibacterium fritillariae]|uniref:Uncharacterized protein n=1 Tax=Okibacterium fritillariae TaxID=123320 RepID=A0A1T5IE48_9MICO|nr:hypothetical protein [Okibacterium fritillariae]SKC37417.1 hypothetical protein SAMN06309945_0318 [Okibacterium fritillariae]